MMKSDPVLLLIDYKAVFDYFGGDTKNGRAAYWQFVYRGIGQDEASPLDMGMGIGFAISASLR